MNKMIQCVHSFVMGDLYTMYESLMLFVIKWYKHICTIPLPLRIDSVHVKTTDSRTVDITNEYLTKKNWHKPEFGTEYLVYVTWSYLDKEYKYVFKNTEPIEFPVYTLEELRNPGRITKVISVVASGDCDNELLMKYAGPFRNFYKGKAPMKIEWIMKGAPKVEVMDSVGNTHKMEKFLVFGT